MVSGASGLEGATHCTIRLVHASRALPEPCPPERRHDHNAHMEDGARCPAVPLRTTSDDVHQGQYRARRTRRGQPAGHHRYPADSPNDDTTTHRCHPSMTPQPRRSPTDLTQGPRNPDAWENTKPRRTGDRRGLTTSQTPRTTKADTAPDAEITPLKAIPQRSTTETPVTLHAGCTVL